MIGTSTELHRRVKLDLGILLLSGEFKTLTTGGPSSTLIWLTTTIGPSRNPTGKLLMKLRTLVSDLATTVLTSSLTDKVITSTANLLKSTKLSTKTWPSLVLDRTMRMELVTSPIYSTRELTTQSTETSQVYQLWRSIIQDLVFQARFTGSMPQSSPTPPKVSHFVQLISGDSVCFLMNVQRTLISGNTPLKSNFPRPRASRQWWWSLSRPSRSITRKTSAKSWFNTLTSSQEMTLSQLSLDLCSIKTCGLSLTFTLTMVITISW